MIVRDKIASVILKAAVAVAVSAHRATASVERMIIMRLYASGGLRGHGQGTNHAAPMIWR